MSHISLFESVFFSFSKFDQKIFENDTKPQTLVELTNAFTAGADLKAMHIYNRRPSRWE